MFSVFVPKEAPISFIKFFMYVGQEHKALHLIVRFGERLDLIKTDLPA